MMTTPFTLWAGFFLIVILLLVFDLGLLHRKERDIGIKESLWLSLGYIAVSICFGFAICHYLGQDAGEDFFTGYLIEKSLSMDNIFVMSLVFHHFAIPQRYQHPVLFWGILGVVILRGLMIGLGAFLIEEFHSILYLFGAFLIFTGIRMLFLADKEEAGLEENKILGWLRKHMNVTESLHGKKFFVRENGLRKATPLLLVLLFIELADIVFAMDSVPAVFAVTTDPFIVYTSNIFAILGLRALYFALSAMLHRFAYLKYSLAVVLVFIGGKIFLPLLDMEITSPVSLAITLGLLACGVISSLYKTRNDAKTS
jgi:tellurite resistance protein TerC